MHGRRQFDSISAKVKNDRQFRGVFSFRFFVNVITSEQVSIT